MTGTPLSLPAAPKGRVVILGGGFGGIELARSLRRSSFQVVLIDRNNYHTFQPLLYQVATGGLEPDSIAYPIRKIFRRQRNLLFRMDEAERVDTESNTVHTRSGTVPYDFLVVATGGASHFFGNDALEAQALGLKCMTDALDVRSLLLQNFEKAQAGPSGDAGLLNVVIVGGGPTGVEIAGALAEFKKHVVPADYPEISPAQVNIVLVEAAGRLLGGFSGTSARRALRALTSMGVQVRLETSLREYDGRVAVLSDGSHMATNLLLWSAGIKGCRPDGLNRAAGKNNRLQVNAFNRVEKCENVFAIGDAAVMAGDPDWPDGHPMVAQPAIQQGRHLGKNLRRIQNKKPLIPFRYKDLGSLATIGRNRAVAEFGHIRFGGAVAWWLWMAVHLMALVGYRNRLIVFINWVWSYFSYDRAIRLIIRPFRRKELTKNSG